MNKISKFALALLITIGIWWVIKTPPAHYVIAPSVNFVTPTEVLNVTAKEGSLQKLIEHIPSDIPGYDDFVAYDGGKQALITAIDGWIWHLDFESGITTRFADAPLMPAGLHEVPNMPDKMYLCSSHYKGENYPESESVGLYQLDMNTKRFAPIVLNVPSNTPTLTGYEADAVLYSDDDAAPEIDQFDPTAEVRPLAFCNDLEVSEDGKRIYFTEPFAYEGASMGGGAVGEAITLGGNGRLWRHDLETGKTRLIAQGYNFIDGILTEPALDGGREQSLLISQTSAFGITRFNIAGPHAGKHEYLWQGLPGMPDGIDRDSQGRIW